MSKKYSVGSSFVQPDVGTEVATIVGVVDVGVQPEEIIKSGPKAGTIVPPGPKVVLLVELVDTPQPDGKPTVLWLERTIKFGPRANLASDFKALLGLSESQFDAQGKSTGYELEELLGKSALVSLVKTTTGNTRVAGFVKLMKGTKVTPAQSELLFFEASDPDKTVYEKLPETLRKKVDASEESPVAGSNLESSTLTANFELL